MLVLLAISCVLGLSLVWMAHVLRVRKLLKNEVARKIVHLAHAMVVVGWPVFVGYWLVIVGELVFLAAVLAAQEYRIFHELRQIDRKTWGEFFFPLGVLLLALLAPPVWVFVASILFLGLADGAAAIVGTRLKSHSYTIFGHNKTLAGSLAFFSVAVVVLLAIFAIVQQDVTPAHFLLTLLVVPLAATLTENFSPYGSDNLTIPLVVYFSLAALNVF